MANPPPVVQTPAATPSMVPFLPESAPFSPEQRAYLNGLLAGLFSRVPAPTSLLTSPAPVALRPLAVLFGSQTGNAEKLAKRIAREAGRQGFAATIHELGGMTPARLAGERTVLIVTSTYGDGEPPDNARAFWTALAGADGLSLAETRFSVCALGDTNYPKFCAFGRELDARLAALGAIRVQALTECDVEFEAPFQLWLGAALGKLKSATDASSSASASVSGPVAEATDDSAAEDSGWSRERPFPAPLLVSRVLNGVGSAKETRHIEFALGDSRLNYTAGDALGVFPVNDPELVADLIRHLGATGEEPVRPALGAPEISLREALMRSCDITRVPGPLLQAVAERSGDAALIALTRPGVNGELTAFLRGRDVFDLLAAHSGVRFSPAELVGLLKRLSPRLYSIASSPRAHAGQVHLCVGVVRYEAHGRARQGVCSNFLGGGLPTGATASVFVHTNPKFRLPSDGSRPVIMVGPGTGIAPFRGFLHDRQGTGATGRNWLFFGDQRADTDFLYRDELERWHHDGFLHRLDTAFSRDQTAKVYVQHRMREQAGELYEWLESGACFYVCGDASRMAADVDAALHEVIQTGGGRTPEQAKAYVEALRQQQRYCRDVY